MNKVKDPRQFGRVAVLMGGSSSEREVSLNSGANVLTALRARGVDAHAVDGIPALIDALCGSGLTRHSSVENSRDASPAPSRLKPLPQGQARFDRVFNILHGNKGGGEDGVLQGLLEALDVPCTGSGVLGTALAMDKIRSKQVWLSLGLPTPRYVRLAPGDDVHAAARSLGLPVIVKPSCEGSSVGVSRVFNDADLDDAVELAARYPGELLMEQLIEGQELTVGILGEQALPSIRIVPAGEYYDYHAKYVAEDTQYLCPGLDGDAETEIRRLCLEAFHAIGCSGWSRVDVMRDKNGKFFLLEVNTAPGMTSHSLVPKAAAQIGIDFQSLCWLILETSYKETTAK
jgi:D-alanine-D-alanine ligase